MYHETIVKQPKCVHQCELCCCPIDGKHLKVVQTQNGDFYSSREHFECHEASLEMCADCPFSFDCQHPIQDCFLTHYVYKEVYND